PADRAHVPSLDAPYDRGEPRARGSGAKPAIGAPRRLPLALNRRHQRPGDLGRGLETLDPMRHHVEIARAASVTADRGQRRDRHPRWFAEAAEKEPPDRAGFLERLAQIMDLFRRGLARTGTPRGRARH